MSRRNQGWLLPSSVLYLLLPVFFFALGWLRPLFAVVACAVLIAFWVGLLRDLHASIRGGAGRPPSPADSRPGPLAWRSTLPALLLIVVWVSLSGAGGFGYQHRDYKASNALLLDLIEQPWPLTVSTDAGPQRVVYYLAYYLPAAAVGKLLGWGAANAALFLWTLLGTLLAFVWFWRLARGDGRSGGLRPFFLALLFIGAGGLDLIGASFLQNGAVAISSENEWWAGYFQYSSNTTLLYWVPQQAIAAWLAIGLVCNAATDGASWRYLAIMLAALVLWTPFGLVGVLPFLGLSLLEGRLRREPLLQDRSLPLWTVAGMLVGVVHALYIASNSRRFPSGILWQMVDDRQRYIVYVAAFWVLEFALLGALVLVGALVLRRRASLAEPRAGPMPAASGPPTTRTRLGLSSSDLRRLVVALIILLVLPAFSVSYYNALAMRASIPALFVLWISSAKFVDTPSPRRFGAPRILRTLVIVALIAGMYPGAVNVFESLASYHLGPPDPSSVLTTATANRTQIVQLRFGDPNAIFYRTIGR